MGGELEDGQASGPFVVGGNDVPGGVRCGCANEHVVGGFVVEIPFFAVTPVFGADFPEFVGVGLAFFEAAKLFFFGEVEVEFEQECAVVGKEFFELVDLVVGALPFFF